MLFIVCLLLPLALARDAAAGGWRQRLWPLLGLVTAFTVGHSITLGLASLRILSVPPQIIEPLIAVTIALTAFDNIRRFMGDRRVVAAFTFGLIHGFGFAGPLIELNLQPLAMASALLQFNLGVEAGQLLVVAVAGALLWPPARARLRADADSGRLSDGRAGRADLAGRAGVGLQAAAGLKSCEGISRAGGSDKKERPFFFR